MLDFEITLNGKTYKCSSTSSNGKGDRSWDISVNHGQIRTQISIPMSEKLTRAKVLLFIEAMHETLRQCFNEQGIDQNYIMNQKHTIM